MYKKPLHLSYICLAVAALTISSVFSISGFFLGIVVTVVVAIAWGIFIWRKWLFGNILSMLIFVLGISLGAIFEGSRLILFIGLLATLSTWDLAAFHAQLSASENIAEEYRLIRTHLLRLASALIIGLVLPLVAFTFQLDLAFWQVFLLGILLIAGLSQIFVQLKRGNES